MADSVTDVEWEKIGAEWVEWREQWRAGAEKGGKELKETEVREKLMVDLLAALGWAKGEWHTEVICKIKVGSGDPKDVEADDVLAPQVCVQHSDGKNWWVGGDNPWAVVELKRPGKTAKELDAARQQARSYADHIRVPVYAVIDGDSIRVWHRRLVLDDELVAELELTTATSLVEKRQEIEAYLREDRLKALRNNLKNDHVNTVAEAAALLPDPAHAHELDLYWCFDPDSRQLSLPDGGLDTAILAETWWGDPGGVQVEAPVRLALAGDFGDDPSNTAPALCALVCRLVLHGGVRDLFVDEPDAWKRALKRYPMLGGDDGALEDAQAKAHQRGGEIQQPAHVDPLANTPADLVDVLSSALDTWTEQAVKATIDQILDEYSTKDRPLTWSHGSVADKLRPLWSTHKDSITHVLIQSTIQNGGRTSDPTEARVRLGPHHIHRLVDCLLFSLILIEHVPGIGILAAGQYGANLRVGAAGSSGFSYALPVLHPTEDVLQRIANFATSARVLVLTAMPQTAYQLAKPHPIGKELHGPPVIGDEQGPMLFSLEGDARSKLSEGWAPFVTHLEGDSYVTSVGPEPLPPDDAK